MGRLVRPLISAIRIFWLFAGWISIGLAVGTVYCLMW